MSVSEVLNSSIIGPGGCSSSLNPFQRQMCSQKEIPSSSDAFEAPLPLSSARGSPDLFSSFPRVFHFAWPCLHLVALEGAATTAQLASRRYISLLFVVAGSISIYQQNVSLSCSAGDCVFLTESSALWQSSDYSVVCLMFSPEHLTEGLKMVRHYDLEWKFSDHWNISRPVCRKASDGVVEASLLSTLRHLLNVTSELVLTHPILFTRLGISSQLCLLAALFASPDLTQSLVCEDNKQSPSGVGAAIEELTNYMTHNLSEPLNLTILEKYSHYSRRSLQYAFRQKFGCTITQWIRSQRLDQACGLLREGNSKDTVTSIANACGYRSVSLFSIEFQKRFHIKPSVLLRENQHRA